METEIAMETSKEYFAFISYKREDEKWAKWFQHELENYHLPTTLNGLENLPKTFRPVFRDVDELKAGNLPEQIYKALERSVNLVVICSPLAAKSDWVNKEITDFISIGKKKEIDNVEHIYPFIVDGVPNAIKVDMECYPAALKTLSKVKERVGGNVNESGRDKAFVKVLAGMLPSVKFDMLWNRYERDKAMEEQRKREERDKLLKTQSRFLSEKASQLVDQGDSYLATLLTLEVLPKNLDNPDRPYTEEAELVLRKLLRCVKASIKMPFNDIQNVDISFDERYILSCQQYGNKFVLCDFHTGAILWSYSDELSNSVSACFSPDGKYFLTATPNRFKIWDTEKRCLVKGYKIKDRIQNVSFNVDGSRLLVEISPDDKMTDVKILVHDWNLNEVTSVINIASYASCIKCSSDGKYIATTYYRSIDLWNADTGKLVRSINVCDGYINTLEFSKDSKILVCTNGETMSVWDVESGMNILTVDEKSISYASFTPNGKDLISCTYDGNVSFWSIDSKEALYSYRENVDDMFLVKYTPKGNYIVNVSNWYVHVWKISMNGSVSVLQGHTYNVYSTEFSPDGRYILSGSGDSTIRLWDVESGECIRELPGVSAANGGSRATFHPNGKWIAITSGGNSISLHSLSDSTTLKTFVCKVGTATEILNGKHIYDLKFSPDGNTLASMSFDSKIRLWNVTTGESKVLMSAKDQSNAAISFSPDGSKLAVISLDGFVEIWDMETYHNIYTIDLETTGSSTIEFSPDGKMFATGSADEIIKLWNTEDGKLVSTLQGHKGSVNTVAFSPDGKYLVSGSQDGTLKIWNVQSGKCIDSWQGHDGAVYSVCFSPDGGLVVSGSEDSDVTVWEFKPLQELMDGMRKRFENRPLTIEEKQTYYLE